MTNLLIAFYVGGYVSSLLNARSVGTLTISGSLYLLLWPLYGIITLMEIVNQHSDTIWSVTKTLLSGVFSAVKWFFGLFRSKE